MPNVITSGSATTVEVDADGNFAAGALTLSEVVSATLSMSRDAIDVTNNDSAGNKEFIHGDLGATFSVESFYTPDNNDALDLILDDIIATGTFIWIRYRPMGSGTGKEEYSFKAIATSAPIPSRHAEGIKITCEFQATGAITRAYQ